MAAFPPHVVRTRRPRLRGAGGCELPLRLPWLPVSVSTLLANAFSSQRDCSVTRIGLPPGGWELRQEKGSRGAGQAH